VTRLYDDVTKVVEGVLKRGATSEDDVTRLYDDVTRLYDDVTKAYTAINAPHTICAPRCLSSFPRLPT